MGIIALIISVVLFVLSLFVFENKPLHPATLFFGLYSFILLLANLNLYGMIKPSDEAFFLIILMLCSFAIGSLNSFLPVVKIKMDKNEKNIAKRYHLDVRVFYILVAIAILFLLYDIMIAIKYIIGGIPLWQVRNWTLSEFGSDNPIMAGRSFAEEFIRTVVISPIGMLIPPVAAYVFFDANLKTQKTRILILSLTHVALTSIAGGGGRLRIVYYCGCFIMAYLLFSDRKKFQNFNKTRYRKYIIIVGLVAFLAIVLVTTMRLGGGYMWKQIYKYFALPPTLLSVWLPEIDNVSPTYGILSLYGLVGYFFRGLKMLGFDFLVPQAYDDAYNYILQAQEFRDVGYGIGNAFVTPIYYLLIDGGVIFLCMATILLSMIATSIHKRTKKYADIRQFSIYAMMMYGVFETFMTIITAVPIHMITFIFICVVCKKHDYNN